jgi:hypothetical protein
MKRKAARQAPIPAPTGSATANSENSNPLHKEIALFAYSYWEGRGGQSGLLEQDWCRAEQEI